jgi:hypothetical protein
VRALAESAVAWVGRKCNNLALFSVVAGAQFMGGLLARLEFISDNESLGLSGFPVVSG